MNKFFNDYNRFFRKLEWLSFFGINPLTLKVAGWIAGSFSHRKEASLKVARVMQRAMYLSDTEGSKYCKFWLKSAGISAFMIFFYKKIDRDCIEKYIEIEDRDTFIQMGLTRGMCMTYHSHQNQNLLGAVLGVGAGKTFGITAAKNPEYDHQAIRHYHIDVMHTDSEKKMGGKYIYLNNPRQAHKDVVTELKNGNIMVGLADFPFKGKSIKGMFFGQTLHAQRWLFDVCVQHKSVVYAALITNSFHNKKPLKLHLRKLEYTTAEELCQRYFDFLEEVCSVVPYAWQGWEFDF